MNTKTFATFAPLMLATLLAASCDRTGPLGGVTDVGVAPSSRASGVFAGVADKARTKIAEQNLSLDSDADGAPKAELTPEGDLLIAGNKVIVTPEQHELLVEHRKILEKIASAGVAIGMQGADLAGKAISNAISGVFSGDTAGSKARIESEAGKVKASARQLCDELPMLLESQQKVAAAVPEFRPYARMTEEDVKDCHSD